MTTRPASETINRRRYPLFMRRVRVLPIPGLIGDVCGVLRFAGGGFRYTVRLDGLDCIREFLPEQLGTLTDDQQEQ